ncbi:acyl-ACP--UDP-N-acetylglucosamine O-acyltransferase [Chroogloeocystis siderophila]|uniref:Acyl-[acyl-carrier-protein]--UDP-N-acetylglucosamine O-acyltransferase n=1 Tax=Chroogloeocystis siderophila 5.2 s.c.1 TaxID=247279 RepID=A0A1U7HW07_9CHRO|nr:acyl-ACP--UDP-N-acetylglucosamine O-acyltransferase [Chroogloeocystis siderophila]OKH27733.1 acyl-[acyl-carrier-protein]--UDP-N-acetylglucosamine O-acyltransferase [Chroogloeocystis siderophila 5.2 s.c.1]
MKTLIHPTAVIHPGADLHPSVQVGPYAVIGEHVKVGSDTIIGAHVVLDGPTEIGVGNHIFPGAAIGLEPQDLKYKGAVSYVKIGNNNRIREYVTINRATGAGEATLIGNNNLLMAYAHVAHNCVIGDSVVIANAVAMAGHVHIESRATIGGVLGIHQFVHIGKLAMVGGMSRIDRDVPPYMLVEGSPARVRSLNLIGLKRAGISELDDGKVLQTLKKAFRTLYRSGLTLNQALEKLDLLQDNEHLQHLRQFLQLSQMSGRRGLIPGRTLDTRSDE